MNLAFQGYNVISGNQAQSLQTSMGNANKNTTGSDSGAIIIAFAEIMKKYGYNYQKQLFVEAIDISEMCFKMTYIQLSLLGIPAKVLLGDTLAMKFKERLYTQFYFLSGIAWKLKQQKQKNEFKINSIEQGKTIQLSLF